jgi:hypothetical protein
VLTVVIVICNICVSTWILHSSVTSKDGYMFFVSSFNQEVRMKVKKANKCIVNSYSLIITVLCKTYSSCIFNSLIGSSYSHD